MNETKNAIIALLKAEIFRFNQCAAKGLDCSHIIDRISVYEDILNTVYDCDVIFSYRKNGEYSFDSYSRKKSKFVALSDI